MKRKLSTLLFTLLIIVSLVTPYATTNADTLKLNKAKATMEIDSTLKLSLAGIKATDIVWTSSNNAIAKVSKWGTITAKSEGLITITGSYNDTKYTCNVTVVDSNKTVVTPAVTYEKTLTEGKYLVGTDIPSGTYTLTCNSGYGIIFVYDSLSDYENKVTLYTSYALASTDSEGMKKFPTRYDTVFNDIKLKDGNYVILPEGFNITFRK